MRRLVVVLALCAGCRLEFDNLALGRDSGDGDGDGGASPCIIDIAGRANHACAVRSDGTLWCTGKNAWGQLGNGTISGASVPAQVQGVPLVRQVVTGVAQTYALARDGSVWAWGRNIRYALGDGTLTDRPQPAAVANLPQVVDEIAAGESHVCVLASGQVYCWGWNLNGEVGNGTTTDQPTATQVFVGAVHIAAGGRNTCAIDASKVLWCWGSNNQGQIGNGTMNDPQAIPLAIPSFPVEEVSVGGGVVCARRADATVWCWGRNSSGILVDGTTIDRATPTQIPGVSGVIGLPRALGGRRMCAMIADGTVWCWGETMYGSLGPPPPALLAPTTPAPVPALAGATMLTALSGFTCMRTAAGMLACAGNNESGQLGDGTTTPRVAASLASIACP